MDDADRFLAIERDIASLRDRMGQVESSTKGAWKTLGETKNDLGDLYDDVKELSAEVKQIKTNVGNIEIDMKEMKVNQAEIQSTQEEIKKSLKFMGKVLVALVAIVAVSALVATFKGSDVPQKTAEILLPQLQKLI